MNVDRGKTLGSLSDDELLIVYLPEGYRYELVIISMLKHALMTDGMNVAQRMEFLEGLANLPHALLTADAVVAVQPACDTAIEMIHEAMSLPMNETFRLIGSFDMFCVFAKLNPSLLTAIKMCNQGYVPSRRVEHAFI